MKKIFTTLLAIIAIGITLWISAILFVGIAVVAAIGYGLYFARGFLTEKGILNPTPGVPVDEAERITIIEGDFERVEEKDPQ